MATSSASTAAGSPRATASRTGWSGTRVWTCTRAHGAPVPRAPTRRAARTKQRQRLLGRREPRREQVQVDVEEDDRRRLAHPVQHGLGADEDRRRRDRRLGAAPRVARPPRPRRPRGVPRAPRATGSRRPAASSCAAARRRRRRPAASRRSGDSAAPPRRAAGLRRRRNARSGPARRSGGRRGAGHRRSGCRRRPGARGPRRRRGHRARPGRGGRTPRRTSRTRVGSPAVHPLERRPTCPLPGRRRRHRPDPGVPPAPPAARARPECTERPAGGPSPAARRPRCRSARSPPGRTRRAHRARPRRRAAALAPRRRPGSPRRRASPPAPRPRRSSPGSPAAQPCRESLGPAGRGDEHQDAALAGPRHRVLHHGEHQVDQVGGRGQPDDGRLGSGPGAPPTPRPPHRHVTRPAGAGQGRRLRQGPHDGGRRRCVQEEGGGAGPAPRRPLGQLDHVGGGPQPSHDLSGSTSTPSGVVDVRLDHPATHAAPVERHAHPGAHADLVAPARRARRSRTSCPAPPPRCAPAPYACGAGPRRRSS